MSKKVIITVVVLIVVGVAVFLVMSNSGQSNQNNNTNTTSNINTAINSNLTTINAQNRNSFSSFSNQTQGSTNDISVTNSGFSPSTLTITAGGQVKWTNNTSAVVYVAPDDHPTHVKYQGVWNDDGSGQISPGQSYSHTFTVPGTYTFHDHLNSLRTGTIVVQ